MYDGAKGETYAKIMQTLVRCGELYGAQEMVPIITNANELRTYTSCRFYEDDKILSMITGGEAK
ncbi:MAG: DUF521 domain-containing protein [Clostridia bacterium]|nr:DUF521 domain-containing protein [Clostridia bacterium]